MSRRSPRRSRSIGLVGLAAALAVGVPVGCSDDAPTLDRGATEQAVAEVVQGRIEPKVLRTRCPAEVPLEEGREVGCTLTLVGTVGPDAAEEPVDPADAEGTLRVRVTQADADGTLEVVLQEAVVEVAEVVVDLEAQLKATFGRSFDASCGEVAHRVVAPDGTFTCRARDQAGPRTVRVTVTDTAGTLRYDVLD